MCCVSDEALQKHFVYLVQQTTCDTSWLRFPVEAQY